MSIPGRNIESSKAITTLLSRFTVLVSDKENWHKLLPVKKTTDTKPQRKRLVNCTWIRLTIATFLDQRELQTGL